MTISVVVPTYNRRASLKRLLESLFRQDIGSGEMEIVVVVDGSTDGTEEMLRELRAPCAMQVLSQTNAGQAEARNTGWRAATGRIVLFLDDDLVCSPTLLSEHLAAHPDGDDDGDRVVVGRIIGSTEGRPSLAYDLINQELLEWDERLKRFPELKWPVDAYVFANCSVSRRSLERVGGFDPAFHRALEDHDLGLRLWAHGARFVYAPRAAVEHRYAKSSRDLVREAGWYGRAEVRLSRKHESSLQHTSLARMAASTWWKRALLRGFARSAWTARLCLGTSVALIERIPSTSAKALGRRLLRFRLQATRLRAAVDEMGGWREFDARFSRRLAVLMYHRIGPKSAGSYPELTVSEAAFERHVTALKRREYSGITPTEYQAWRLGKSALPRRAVMLTFDDGYADLAQHAFPILERHGFGSCVFVVTGEIGGSNSWDRARGSATLRLLSREQIVEGRRMGIEFGGHSRTHPSLPSAGDDQLHEEVSGCRADVEDLTGETPAAFAYPYGEFDPRVVSAVRASFPLAFSAEEGLNHLATDAHLLHRTMVLPHDSAPTVVLRVLLGYSPWDVLRRWRAAAAGAVKRLINRRRGATRVAA